MSGISGDTGVGIDFPRKQPKGNQLLIIGPNLVRWGEDKHDGIDKAKQWMISGEEERNAV